MSRLEELNSELTALEQELCTAIAQAQNTGFDLQRQLAPSRQALHDLKLNIDRLRPLLWVWMHRLEAEQTAAADPKPATNSDAATEAEA